LHLCIVTPASDLPSHYSNWYYRRNKNPKFNGEKNFNNFTKLIEIVFLDLKMMRLLEQRVFRKITSWVLMITKY